MEFTPEVKIATDPIYQKISKVMPEIEWSVHAPYIHRINQLKKEKNAIVLAHNYQTPEIYHGIADVAADSLALAIEASKTTADIIVMAGVHFMAETSKLMSPEKKVLLPDMAAGCSLSSSITGKDVRLLKEKYPGVPVVSYVNTSAEVFTYETTGTPGYFSFNNLTSLPVIDDDKEQPAAMSGSKTFFSGLINLEVSAIKWTPAITIISAVVFEASIASANESAATSAIP